jgi:hypothetical protein
LPFQILHQAAAGGKGVAGAEAVLAPATAAIAVTRGGERKVGWQNHGDWQSGGDEAGRIHRSGVLSQVFVEAGQTTAFAEVVPVVLSISVG